MAKRQSTDDLLDQIGALRAGTLDAAGLALLEKGLAHKASVVVQKAAGVVRDRGVRQFTQQLVDAFDRFLAGGGSDKGCLAKKNIAEALYETEADRGEVFLRGARHVQMESSFGGSVDAAAELRGVCALGLVRCGHPEAMEVLADLLADREMQVRVMAARALGYLGHDHGALLLRLRVLIGDREDDVMAESLLQIVRLSPGSLEFVARFLDDQREGVQQAAALAIASSREMRALEMLTARWERSLHERAGLAMAITTHRSTLAIDFLLERLQEEDPRVAAQVLEALRLHERDDAIWSRVRPIAEARRLA